MKILRVYISLFFIIIIINSIPTVALNSTQEWITIFIHGTLGIRSNISLDTIIKLFQDRVENSTYACNTAAIRNNPFLFTMQPIQELGLKKIISNCSSPCGSSIFSLLFNQLIRDYKPWTKNYYYTYGWSGLLSYTQRYEEARILYRELRQELKKLAAKNSYPKIRIVTYSHGGNLSLNLAAIRDYEYHQDRFSIDELITFGMPVQHANSCLIFHPIFKKIYHIYSAGDNVQRLDLFSPCNLFSRKRFHGKVPRKLTQIELRVTAPFLKVPFIHPPSNARRITNQSPGHIELWFFGWALNNYRRNFVFYPLPMAIFAPYIVYSVERYLPQVRHVIFDIRPHQERALLRHRGYSCTKVIPFLTRYKLVCLQKKAAQFHPGHKKYINKYLKLQCTLNPNHYR